jgi:hypothetical protein
MHLIFVFAYSVCHISIVIKCAAEREIIFHIIHKEIVPTNAHTFPLPFCANIGECIAVLIKTKTGNRFYVYYL